MSNKQSAVDGELSAGASGDADVDNLLDLIARLLAREWLRLNANQAEVVGGKVRNIADAELGDLTTGLLACNMN
jgi:hypothetical protein